MSSTIWSWAPGNPPATHLGNGGASSDGLCVYISSSDARWRVESCDPNMPVACRKIGESLHWAWALETSSESACPDGFVAGAPRHALENNALQAMLISKDIDSARLAVHGWHPPPSAQPSHQLNEETVEAYGVPELVVL